MGAEVEMGEDAVAMGGAEEGVPGLEHDNGAGEDASAALEDGSAGTT